MSPGPNLFRTPEGERLVLDACDRHLASLAVPWKSVEVMTRHGRTHVVEAGPPDGKPLLFLHAMGCHVGLFAREINAFSRRHRVIAPDLPGQPGRSTHRALAAKGPAFGEWQCDVLDHFAITRAAVVGVSLGGYAALKLAGHAPERVSALVAVVPAGLSKPPMLRVLPMLWRIAIGRVRGGNGWLKRSFGGLVPGEPPEDAFFDFLELSSRHFRFPVHPYPVLRREELAQFGGPALVLAGEHDPIYDAAAQLEGARKVLGDVDAQRLDGLGHFFSNAEREKVCARIDAFLAAQGA